MSKVSVRNDNNEVVARVEFNRNLDHWDGRNWSCGATGRHLGLTRLRDGRYVLIHGTDWQGERDSAESVSADTALQAIMHAEQFELLDMKRFSELKKLYKDTIGGEMIEEEE